MADAVVVIPARMASTRLPGKPLAEIAGRPMIAHMVEIARKADLGPVIVAAAEPEIASAAVSAGAAAILTEPDLPSGTDRVHAALHQLGLEAPYVVNLQGDMPTIDPKDVQACAELLSSDGDIATLASETADPAAREDPNLVKAILAQGDPARALYFTRAAAPWGEGPIYRHVGLYAFRREALDAFVALPPSPLERREKLEQLRALENGMTILVGLTPRFPKGVDSPEDLARVRAELGGFR